MLQLARSEALGVRPVRLTIRISAFHVEDGGLTPPRATRRKLTWWKRSVEAREALVRFQLGAPWPWCKGAHGRLWPCKRGFDSRRPPRTRSFRYAEHAEIGERTGFEVVATIRIPNPTDGVRFLADPLARAADGHVCV